MRAPFRFVMLTLLLAFTGLAAAKSDLDYERLRGALNDLAADPALGQLAVAERALADQSVQAITTGGRSDHAHLVYIAERRVDIAYATAQAMDQERRLDQLDREHDRILLAASRRDAEQARLEAEKQRIQSLAQAEEADRLRAEADAARAGRAEARDARPGAAPGRADQAPGRRADPRSRSGARKRSSPRPRPPTCAAACRACAPRAAHTACR